MLIPHRLSIFILNLHFQAVFKNNFAENLFMALVMFFMYTSFLLYHAHLISHIPRNKQLFMAEIFIIQT